MNTTEKNLMLLSAKIALLSMATTDEERNQIKNEIASLSKTLPHEPEPREWYRHLKFNEKEVFKMPTRFRKIFRVNGCTAHVRKRTNGRYNCSYEIRYRRDGYNISASGPTLEIAKANFIEKTKNRGCGEVATAVPSTVIKFTEYWLENFHKPKVAANTYAYSTRVFKQHIKSFMSDIELRKVTPLQIKGLLDRMNDIPRTREGAYGILNQVFKSAISHGIIQYNPLSQLYYATREREHGSALTVPEEQQLLTAYADPHLCAVFALILYTGLRPCEYQTAVIDGDFVVAQNCKRKGGKMEYKKIPITPMLRPYLPDLEFPLPTNRVITLRYKKAMPNHRLYDLRVTFNTRCIECGVADDARKEFMGHTDGKIARAYTDLSDEYLLREGAKFKY